MSFKYTALAMDHGPADPYEKLLLMSLTDRSDEKGVCFPSRADLMRRTGMANATLSKKLRMLEVQGWIQRKQRFNSSTVFRINVGRLLTMEADANRRTVTTVPKGFEPFEDEVSQTIENKGDATREHTDATREHTDATGRHLTYHLTNQLTLKAQIDLKNEWLKDASGLPFAKWQALKAKKAPSPQKKLATEKPLK